MVFNEEDFGPALTPMERYRCSCEKKGPFVPCDIRYIDEEGIIHRVCYRQQCQECGFVRKNRIGKILYYSLKEGPSNFNFLPEFFWAPDEVTYDENMNYNREEKINFMRRILTLANRDRDKKGHLEYRKEEIYNLDLTNR